MPDTGLVVRSRDHFHQLVDTITVRSPLTVRDRDQRVHVLRRGRIRGIPGVTADFECVYTLSHRFGPIPVIGNYWWPNHQPLMVLSGPDAGETR